MVARKAKKSVRKAAKPVKRAAAKKPAAKKPAAKKAVKRPAAKKAAPKKAAAKVAHAVPKSISVGNKAFTKSQLIGAIADHTGISRKEATNALVVISKVIEAHLGKNGPSVFSWPGMFKMKIVKKPATKARKGINPFTGEPTVFKAKPASRKVKILPLKALKEMAA